MQDVWARYPSGGVEGDYLTIDGVRYIWNKYYRIWEHAGTEISTYTRELMTFYGDVVVQNNLTVAGTIRCKGIRQPNCGLFKDMASLLAHYPCPEVGMWAVIGDTIPGQIWRCETPGAWTATDEMGGSDSVDLTEINEAIAAVDTDAVRAREMQESDYPIGGARVVVVDLDTFSQMSKLEASTLYIVTQTQNP